jgi:RES domain-containing protein
MTDRPVQQYPPISLVRRYDTHRLIPSKHTPRGDSVLVRIANDDQHLQAIFDLDAATNDRLAAPLNLLPGISLDELVYGVPWSRVVNAAFCHAHPLGARFNGPDRGAWYAAFALETSQAEVAFHKSVELAEVGWPDLSVTYDDHLADLSADLHDLRKAAAWRAALDPSSYVASQQLAARLLAGGSLGVVYPSVRHGGGTCVCVFRPALVTNVRRAGTWRFAWAGGRGPEISRAS